MPGQVGDQGGQLVVGQSAQNPRTSSGAPSRKRARKSAGARPNSDW